MRFRMRVRQERPEGPELDRLILHQLRGKGAKLALPRHVLHFLELPGRGVRARRGGGRRGDRVRRDRRASGRGTSRCGRFGPRRCGWSTRRRSTRTASSSSGSPRRIGGGVRRLGGGGGALARPSRYRTDVLFTRKAKDLPTPETALPGRDTPIVVPGDALRARDAARPALPRGSRADRRRHGLLLGRRADVLAGAGRVHDGGRLRGRAHAEPDVRGGLLRANRPRGGRPRGLRPVADELRRDAPHLLGGPRPHPGHAAGQRRRDAVPLRDLLRERRAAGSGAWHRRRVFQAELAKSGYGEITTEIVEAGPFYYAEDYHQQYLAKNPNGYCGLGGTGVSCPIGTGVASS